MSDLQEFLASQHILLTDESIQFITDFMEGHGYALDVKGDKLYRIDTDDDYMEEEYSYKDIFEFIAEEILTLDIPDESKLHLMEKFEELPNYIIH